MNENRKPVFRMKVYTLGNIDWQLKAFVSRVYSSTDCDCDESVKASDRWFKIKE